MSYRIKRKRNQDHYTLGTGKWRGPNSPLGHCQIAFKPLVVSGRDEQSLCVLFVFVVSAYVSMYELSDLGVLLQQKILLRMKLLKVTLGNRPQGLGIIPVAMGIKNQFFFGQTPIGSVPWDRLPACLMHVDASLFSFRTQPTCPRDSVASLPPERWLCCHLQHLQSSNTNMQKCLMIHHAITLQQCQAFDSLRADDSRHFV